MKSEILTIFACFCMVQYDVMAIRMDGRCDGDNECTRVGLCPILLTKARSNDVNLRKAAHNSICKLQRPNIYVCCPKDITEPLDPPTAPNTFTGGESLLPKDCGKPATTDKIVGGKKAPIGGYPWMVAFGYKKGTSLSFECAGSLITSRYVLTAAHCVTPELPLSVLHLGDWDLANDGIDCDVSDHGMRCAPAPHMVLKPEEIIIHETYSERHQESDDIALIRLDRELDFKEIKTISPLCLAEEDFEPASVPKELTPTVAGWGFKEDGKLSNILLTVDVPFANPQRCTELFEELFTSSQICAGGQKGIDSCGGDSGGPLIISGERGPPFKQIGIVSYGHDGACGAEAMPAVYTSVAKYRKWIVDHLKP